MEFLVYIISALLILNWIVCSIFIYKQYTMNKEYFLLNKKIAERHFKDMIEKDNSEYNKLHNKSLIKENCKHQYKVKKICTKCGREEII